VKRLALMVLIASGLVACEEAAAPSSNPTSGVPTAVLLTPALDTLSVGETVQLAATVIDTSGGQAPCIECEWASSDPAVAGISGTGLVTALGPGTAVITATLGDISATDTLAVVDSATPPQPPQPPPGSTVINPGDDITARVDTAPPGTAFTLKAGVHRLTGAVTPKEGMSFTGEPGAVVSGARLLSTFSREGSFWVASGQTQEGQRLGNVAQCFVESTRCTYPEEFFIDDAKLRHVASLSQVGPGTWYFDYPADKIYFRDDPAGRKIETSVAARAFGGTAANVTIRGLVIEKFASPFQEAAVRADSATGWVIESNEVRWNHGVGILTGTRATARGNYAHHNVQLGMGGSGDDALVEGNEIAYNNNPQEINYGWAAGGTKWTRTRNLVLRGNYVHDNLGPGLWTDIDNISALIENNRVDDNTRCGIFHEISYDAVIRFNTAARNGSEATRPVRGGGIQVTSSPNVEIYGNTLVDNHAGFAINQDERGAGAYGPYELQNLYVHDNTVTLAPGTYTGLGVTVPDWSYYTSRNNRFENNTYYLEGNSAPFWWQEAPRSVAEWQNFGQDVGGTFHP
jgi:hypothetical protein